MKTVLLLFITSLQFVAVSQNSDKVFAFEDYRKCYTGFKTYAGDTVHEAKFLNVYTVYSVNNDRANYCWVVDEGGRYGLLNPKGEYVLQSQFDTIFGIDRYSHESLKKDWLIISANGKFGVIDYKGKEILPSIYQHIEPYEKWLRVRNSDGKIGLLDSLLRIDVPFEFDDIYFDVVHHRSMDTTVYNAHFHAKKNGYFGLLNADLSPILPYEFENLRIRCLRDYYENSPMYILGEKEGRTGLYSYEGKLIIPHEFEAIDLHDDKHYPRTRTIQTASAFSKGWYTFFNIETGDRSEAYRELRLAEGKAIAQNKKSKWWVIDSNGSEMGSGSKDWYAHEETLSLHDSIVQLSTTRYGKKSPYRSVLYHYGKGTFSSEECNWLLRVEIDGEHYCWSKLGNKFIIYDSQLRKVKTIEGMFTDILEDLRDEGYQNTLPIQIMRNDEGFIGGFDARGTEVIPQKYDGAKIVIKEEYHKHRPYFRVPDYFEFHNDSSLAYYSLNGELIRELNFSSIYPLSNHFYAAKVQNYTSVLDLDYTVVLDSCSRAFQYSALNKDWSVEFSENSTTYNSLVYAFRNQKVYEEVDGSFKLMDSSRYDFKNKLQFQFDVLIDRSGSIISPEGAKVKRIGGCYISEKHESITIFSLDGSVNLLLDGVAKFELLGGDLFHCRFRNGQQGIYNTRYSKWMLLPKDQFIVPITGEHGKAKYCIRRPRTDDDWQFYSADGKIVSDLELDGSMSYMSSANIVRIEGKLGVLSSKLEMLLPAEYDYISSFKNSVFLKKNNLWFITSLLRSKISQGYSAISTSYYPNGRLVFQNGLIGVIDQNFQEIVPPTTEQELLEKYDLAKLLMPTDNKQINQFPIVSESNKEQSMKINNRIILEVSRYNTTKNDVMPLALQYNGDLKLVQKLNRKIRYKRETPSFFSKSYYACSINTNSSIWGESRYARNEEETIHYYNYEWKGGKLEKIVLTDLFDSPYYVTHLDSLIIDYVNENQLYGISCVDLNALLTTAKENFILKPEGILLLAMDRNTSTILIPYSEMQKFLKRPEEFKGK